MLGSRVVPSYGSSEGSAKSAAAGRAAAARARAATSQIKARAMACRVEKWRTEMVLRGSCGANGGQGSSTRWLRAKRSRAKPDTASNSHLRGA